MALVSIAGTFSRGWAARTAEVGQEDPWHEFVWVLERTGSGWRNVQRFDAAQFWSSPEAANHSLASIERLLRVQDCDGARRTERVLSIPAGEPDGFDITLWSDPAGVRASFGGLDQDFATAAGAMIWVRRALSSSYRLAILVTGGFPREWRLAPVDAAGTGLNCLASGYPTLSASFRTQQRIYKQNRLFGLECI